MIFWANLGGCLPASRARGGGRGRPPGLPRFECSDHFADRELLDLLAGGGVDGVHAAGAIGGVPGSPTPPCASLLGTIYTSIVGMSAMRSIR